MTARVSRVLKSRASLTCLRDCFFPGRDKDLSAHRHDDNDDDKNAWVVAALCEQLLAGFRLGEKRAIVRSEGFYVNEKFQ